MSGLTRRLNYTQRQRVMHEDVVVSIHRPTPLGLPVISASISLSEYDLPADARVFLEAYRQSAWQRFDFGSVGALVPPPDRSLLEFGDGDGVQFRVKVVEALASSDGASRILAQADGIKPKTDGPRRSLLPLDPDPNLFHEVWRLELDETDGPLVKVSTHLVRDRHAFARSPQFLSLVIPEILRKSLSWAIRDGRPSDEEWDTPRGRWVRFGCSLLSQSELPSEIDGDDEDLRDRWVESAVSSFSRTNRVSDLFGNWWREESGNSLGVER
jgi:hypothetical protein